MIEMQASTRSELGSSASRRIVKKGLVPAVLYGNKQESIHISLCAKEITKLYHSGYLTSTLVNIMLDGGKKNIKALVKQIQCDPVKDSVRHVEMLIIGSNKQEVDVPIIFADKDKCPGVKRGGYFNIVHRKLKVSSIPEHIPQSLKVDSSQMRIGQKMLAKDIPLPENIALAVSADTIIVSIIGRGKQSDNEERPASAPAA